MNRKARHSGAQPAAPDARAGSHPAAAGLRSISGGSTTEQQTAAALRRSETWAQAVFEQAAVGMAVESLDGYLLRANDRLCTLFGLSRDQLVGRHWRELIDPAFHAARAAAAARLAADPQVVCTMDQRYRHRCGAAGWVRVTLSTVSVGPQEPPCLLVVIEEISAQKHAQQEAERAGAAALELARLQVRHAAEAEALAAVSTALSSTLELSSLYRIILEQAAALLPWDHAALLLYDAEGWAVVAASQGRLSLPAGARVFRVADIAGVAAAGSNGTPARIADTAALETWLAIPPFTGEHQIRSTLVVPIVVDSAVVGTLNVDSCTPQFYSEEHLATAVTFGRYMAQAWQNASLYSAEKRAREALRDGEARLRAAIETAVDGILTLDDHGLIESCNGAAGRLFGYAVQELVGRSVNLLLPESFRRAHDAHLARYRQTGEAAILGRARETIGRRSDGTAFPLLLSLSAMTVGGRHCFTAIVHDLTERKRAEEETRHRLLHDPLTGLPNRALLRERTAQALTRAAQAGTIVALATLDLHRFKELNDTFGHHHGDQVLCAVAKRLRAALPDDQFMARLDGAAFALLLPGADAAQACAAVAHLQAALDEPIVVQEVATLVDSSAGVALYPEHGADADTLLRHTAVAMHLARRSGEPVRVYTSAEDIFTPERLILAGELREAIRAGQLVLHYQPLVYLHSGEVAGVEALVRWQHPTRGLLPPARFISLAEHSGQIGALTTWVLEQAIAQQADWAVRLGSASPVAVNISAATLRDPALCERLTALLAAHAVPASLLRLEVTESLMMADPERAAEVVARLAAMGIGVAIDDYGTGYSNLAALHRLRVEELKIDRSFVSTMVQEPVQQAIVASTVGLGLALGLRVVAEGVEDAATWDRLAALGCQVAQGYYLSRPLPPAQLEQWLQRAAVPGRGWGEFAGTPR